MIKQPDINSVFHPTFLGNRVLAKPVNTKQSTKNTRQNANQSTSSDSSSDAIVINVHLSGHKILQHFGWILAACLWGLVFAFFLMR